jgi:hypothetical protein
MEDSMKAGGMELRNLGKQPDIIEERSNETSPKRKDEVFDIDDEDDDEDDDEEDDDGMKDQQL